jgi:polar amino acid transport system substrate-binding protein
MRTGRPGPSKLTRASAPPARFALLALAASLVLAACGTAAPVKPASEAPANFLPKGAEIVTPTPPPASPPSCNATASLPPPAEMPTPGQMPQGSFMAQVQARGYLNVGVDQNTYLWGYRDPTTGELSGFDIDMLRQVAAAIFGSTDPKYIHFTIVPNADRVSAVQKGLVDIVAETMTINCGREQSVDFSTVYYEAGQKILVPDNSTITGPQDLGGKRVCAANGSTSLQNLRAPGMPHMQLWGVNDETDCLVMLQQGQVDAISTDDAILIGLAAQDPNVKIVGSSFSNEPYGMAISKAHTDFTSFVNGVLAQVRASGRWAQIYDTYLMPYTKVAAPAPPMANYR